MEGLLIRQAGERDVDAIALFNTAMALETENKRLEPAIIEAGVRGLIARPEYGFYLVAECDGATAACLLITYEWSDWRNGLFWWVQSVYVRPEFRRRGIYKAMYAHARELAAARGGVCGLRLYVEQDNESARRTYESLGMTETHYRLYEQAL